MARKRYTRRRSKGRFAFLYKLLAFVVTMALVAVFRYGVQLQKEADETL